MEIETRLAALDHKLQKSRIFAILGVVGVILLYLALAIQVGDSKPVMALSITVCLACVFPSLLRWHAFRVERRILNELKEIMAIKGIPLSVLGTELQKTLS